MNERERFEEWLPGNFINAWLIEDTWKSWQARSEIAKQDEEELVEALIAIKTWNDFRSMGFMDYLDKIIVPLIEKHTGKTWEESQ